MMFLWIVASISWIISLYCLYRIWRGKSTFLKKLLWTVILLCPVLGPLAYGGLFVPPTELPADLRAPEYDQTRHGLGDNYDFHPPEHHH